MRNVLIGVMVLAFGLAFTGITSAEEGTGTESALENAGDRLAEGIQETLEGSVQIPVEIAETAKENPLKAVTVAPIEGAKETALQTTEGAIRTGTFFIPDASPAAPAQTSTPQ